MANDPQIVYPQNPISSSSVLVNVIGAPISFVIAKYGLGWLFPPDWQMQAATVIAMAVMSGANLVVRKWFTAGPLSFDAPIAQTPAQPLPAGSAVLVSTTIAESPAPATVAVIPPGSHNVSVAPPAPPPAASVLITPAG